MGSHSQLGNLLSVLFSLRFPQHAHFQKSLSQLLWPEKLFSLRVLSVCATMAVQFTKQKQSQGRLEREKGKKRGGTPFSLSSGQKQGLLLKFLLTATPTVQLHSGAHHFIKAGSWNKKNDKLTIIQATLQIMTSLLNLPMINFQSLDSWFLY